MSIVRNHFRPRRDKVFGPGRPRPLDREAKVRIKTLARALSRRTEKGKHYGVITAKALDVLDALLWCFHNAKSGLCFPSYKTIAEKAGCSSSTVGEAIKALEKAGLLTWVNRIKRVREYASGLFGTDAATGRVRVVRTSNGYAFIDPRPSKSTLKQSVASKTENSLETPNQDIFSLRRKAAASEFSPLEAALARFNQKFVAARLGRI
jgi:hypothetical protein